MKSNLETEKKLQMELNEIWTICDKSETTVDLILQEVHIFEIKKRYKNKQ